MTKMRRSAAAMRYALLGVATQLSGLALVFTGPSPALKVAGGVVSLLAMGWALRAHKRPAVDADARGDSQRNPSVAPQGFSTPPRLPTVSETPTGVERDSAVTLREDAPVELAKDLKLALLKALIEDKTGFYEFYRESRCRIRELSDETLRGAAAGEALLTLARTSALWGLAQVSSGAEQALRSLFPTGPEGSASQPSRVEDRGQNAAALAPLSGAFRELEDTLALANGHEPDEVLEVSYGAFEALIEQSRNDPEQRLAQLERLRQEPTRHRFRKLRAYAQRAAVAQGQTSPDVEIRDGELLLTRDRFSAVWAGILHLIDNSLEHAFESPEERNALGKPLKGQLNLRSSMEASKIVIEVSDDGRGIDWSKVAERARKAKLRAATRDDLVVALLSGKLAGPTRPNLGLSALNAACLELHGNVTVVSSPGRGTIFRISLPLRSNLAMFVPSLHPSADSRGPSPLAFVQSPVRIRDAR